MSTARARSLAQQVQISTASSGNSVSSTSGNFSASGWRRASRSSRRPFLTFAMITRSSCRFMCRFAQGEQSIKWQPCRQQPLKNERNSA